MGGVIENRMNRAFVQLLGAALLAAPISYDPIDRHALSAPPAVERSVSSLAACLVQPARNDQEKVRAIYRWMTDRIAYDAETFLSGAAPETRAEAILYRRRGVCSGYTALFE